MVRTEARIHSLDYLRGLAAMGIMCYHMRLLSFGETDASTPLAKIKIYGVAIFFILSGLTLLKVYAGHFTKAGIPNFFIKRIFRIVPLLWLATLFTFMLTGGDFTVKKLVTNFLVVPGILKPEIFIANGAWSIGNECGFYLLFPFLLLLIKKNSNFIFLFLLLSVAPFLYFTYQILDPAKPLGLQWKFYVSPFSQFVFFIIGIGLGLLPAPGAILRRFAPLLALAVMLIILFYPAAGEPVVLTTAHTRVVLSLLTTILCYLIYIGDFSFLPKPAQWSLSTLGEISYSVYLLHPLIFLALENLLGNQAPAYRYEIIAATVVLTLIGSYFVYEYFEKYFMELAKHFTAKKKSVAVLE